MMTKGNVVKWSMDSIDTRVERSNVGVLRRGHGST